MLFFKNYTCAISVAATLRALGMGLNPGIDVFGGPARLGAAKFRCTKTQAFVAQIWGLVVVKSCFLGLARGSRTDC